MLFFSLRKRELYCHEVCRTLEICCVQQQRAEQHQNAQRLRQYNPAFTLQVGTERQPLPPLKKRAQDHHTRDPRQQHSRQSSWECSSSLAPRSRAKPACTRLELFFETPLPLKIIINNNKCTGNKDLCPEVVELNWNWKINSQKGWMQSKRTNEVYRSL